MVEGTRTRTGRGNRPQQQEQEKKQESTSRFTGEAGRRQAHDEREAIAVRREAARNRIYEPFRFWMPPNSEREIVVLDTHINFYRYEHALMDTATGRQDRYYPCENHEGGCPICRTGDNYYFAMFLSVIDTEGYQPNDQSKPYVEWSRKMFVVKSGMQNKWLRFQDQYTEGDDGVYGATVRIFRDEQSDPKTGNDIEFLGWAEAERMDGYVRDFVDRDKQHKTEDCREAFDYLAIYPEMTEEEVAREAGVPFDGPTSNVRSSKETRTARTNRDSGSREGFTPGSREEERREFDEGQDAAPFDPDDNQADWTGDIDAQQNQDAQEAESEASSGDQPDTQSDQETVQGSGSRGARATRASRLSREETPIRTNERPRAGSRGSRVHRPGEEKEKEKERVETENKTQSLRQRRAARNNR